MRKKVKNCSFFSLDNFGHIAVKRCTYVKKNVLREDFSKEIVTNIHYRTKNCLKIFITSIKTCLFGFREYDPRVSHFVPSIL